MPFLQNASCPAQPCLTVEELRAQFFALNAGFNETIATGNTSLYFLPGNHFLERELDIINIGEDASISIAGYDKTQPAVIHCRMISGPYFSAFQSVSITNLQIDNCEILPWQNERLIVSNVVFASSYFDVRFVPSVSISNSTIKIGPGSDCARVERYAVFYSNVSQVTVRNVSFSSNSLDCANPTLLDVNSGRIDIADCPFSGRAVHIVLRNTELDVSGTIRFENGINAIVALNSTVIIAGNVSFINNTGYQGGAMSLTDSHMTVATDAHVIFKGNHADYVGGAIFATGDDISNYISVGQTVGQKRRDSCQLIFSLNSTVEFINNTAESGGSAMYGVTTSHLVCTDGLDQNDTLANYDIVTIEPDDFSAVSSDPLRVCICPDQTTPDCLAKPPDMKVYPGQTFTIHAAVVGFNFALTSGSVYAQFLSSDASLGSATQYVQGVNYTGCSQLVYSVLTDKRNVTLVLTTNRRNVTGSPVNVDRDIQVLNENEGYMFFDLSLYNYFPNPSKYYNETRFDTNLIDGVFQIAGNIPRPLQDIAVYIPLTLLNCPPGFALSNFTHGCVCNERLTNFYCNISDQTVLRGSRIWISASFSGNVSNGVLIHQYCPFDYCKEEFVAVDLSNPDTQCAFQRSGILCGGCKTNYSLALGSSECVPNCSNSYLSLLIIFVLAGFALVFFIKVLNLTVSQGTINGLIFYANIVAANRSIFFPAEQNKFLSFLSVFISWLNLDLGIKTCFIKGLSGYGKTWLQFVFPLYVWLIAGAVIVASHYSSRATELFGKNSISVLATLFLFSFIKLLPFLITIFGFTTIVYPDGSTSLIWTFDGNIEYLSSEYIPLFIFAVAIVLLLGVPYTAVLLSAQWLRTKTHRKGLRWLKPFLDAYYGPFKDKCQYWVGVLLVVRGVLCIFFAYFFAVDSSINLMLTIVASILLSSFPSITGRLYKNKYLSVLENSFFVNLGVLAAGTYYIKSRLAGGSQEALVTTSVGVAFFQFAGIVVFHSFYFVVIPLRRKWKAYFKSKRLKKTETESFELSLPFMGHTDVTYSTVYLRKRTSTDMSLTPEEVGQVKTNETQTATNNTSSATSTEETPSQPTYLATVEASDATSNKAAEAPGLQGSNESQQFFASGAVFTDYNSPREALLFAQ